VTKDLDGVDFIFRRLRLSSSYFVELQVLYLLYYVVHINFEIGPKSFVDRKLVQEHANSHKADTATLCNYCNGYIALWIRERSSLLPAALDSVCPHTNDLLDLNSIC